MLCRQYKKNVASLKCSDKMLKIENSTAYADILLKERKVVGKVLKSIKASCIRKLPKQD
jgi:hypothetical protein